MYCWVSFDVNYPVVVVSRVFTTLLRRGTDMKACSVVVKSMAWVSTLTGNWVDTLETGSKDTFTVVVCFIGSALVISIGACGLWAKNMAR